MPFEIVRNDIVNMQVDVVVNSANPLPIVGSGVDYCIHKKAGKELLAARQQIGAIPCGEAKMTPGFHLESAYVIHTVGPVWKGGTHREKELLAACYRNSLELAKQTHCESIAFPLISAGIFGYPKNKALQVAIQEISAFLMEHEMQVYLVVFDKDAFELSEHLFQSVKSYIDDNYISEEFAIDKCMRRMYMEAPQLACDFDANLETSELGELLENLDAGFSETLLILIDKTGKKDSEIYKKANVDRKLFSKIRNNPNYQPSKATALAFAFALELDLEETEDFIGRAGYALSHSNKFDVIIEYFIVHEKFNIFELNEVLFAFDQPLLGA